MQHTTQLLLVHLTLRYNHDIITFSSGLSLSSHYPPGAARRRRLVAEQRNTPDQRIGPGPGIKPAPPLSECQSARRGKPGQVFSAVSLASVLVHVADLGRAFLFIVIGLYPPFRRPAKLPYFFSRLAACFAAYLSRARSLDSPGVDPAAFTASVPRPSLQTWVVKW